MWRWEERGSRRTHSSKAKADERGGGGVGLEYQDFSIINEERSDENVALAPRIKRTNIN